MPLISSHLIIFSKWPVYEQWNPKAPYNINVSAVLITFVAGNGIFDFLVSRMHLLAIQLALM